MPASPGIIIKKPIKERELEQKELKRLDKDIAKAEDDVVAAKKKLAELRRRRPSQEVSDYTLKTTEGKSIKLSSLFGRKEDLIVIQNMGKECVHCTLWADGFNGVHQHLSDRAAFAVVSPNKSAIMKRFAAKRGWKFKILSSHGTSFKKDTGFESNGHPQPGVSIFHKDNDGRLQYVSKAFFDPGDDFCAVWHLFDLLPNGSAGWHPKYTYKRSSR